MASGPLTVKIQINADGSAAIVGLNKVKGALDATGQEAKAASGGFKALSSSLQGLALTAGAALSVGALAQSFVTANIESQRLAKGLAAVAGSATAGAAEMAYISQTADRLGLKMTETGQAYLSLAAATKGTGLEGDKTRQIFESVSLAMGKLGKSSSDTQGALLAIQQSISKGTVSAEELTQQLGERLPGATKVFADSLGVTTAELIKMMGKGDLTIEMWADFAAQLRKVYADGQAVGGLDKEWNRLTNALERMMIAADNASGATSGLGSVLQWATGVADSFAQSLDATANARAGLGFRTFEDDTAKFGAAYQARAQALDAYVQARKRADSYRGDLSYEAGMEADAAAALKHFQDMSIQANNLRTGLDSAAAAQEALNQKQAAGVGDDMVARWNEHNAAVAANAAEIAKLNGQYDKSIAKKAEYAKMEAALTEAVKLGTLSAAERTVKLAAFAAAQDKAAESSRSHAKALSAEAQVVAQVEQKYGLMKGQLDAVWQMESSRGKGAGIGTKEWVKDLGQGNGHMTQLVGQFRMAAATAKGLGADMTTFNGQADAAGKYLAEAAAQGKTLWEQFAYYHGGPNKDNWKEATRAYADAAVKLVATTLGTQRDIGQNTGQVITDSLNHANQAVQGMIQRYLPAEAAARAYAQALEYLANSSDFAALSQEKQAIILQGLKSDMEAASQTAEQTADAWAEVWKNAVKRIDDTFANLWQDLFSGAKSTLDSLKKAITSWLAEVAHALLTKPLVVAITAAMTGGSGAAGAVGTATKTASGLSGFSNIGSLFSSIYSLGSTFLSGIAEGITGLFTTNMFSTLSGAFGAITSGSATGMAAGIGVAMPYLLPVIAVAAGIFAKYQKDQKPRYGAYAAVTHGGTGQFEDGVGVKGSFGLTFGMNDRGSANIDAAELLQVFEGFAKTSDALAQFYGSDVAAQVEASLREASNTNWAKNGIMNYAMDVNQAFDVAFTDIIKHAAATGDRLAIVFQAVVGDLSGTAETMAKQIETAMQTSAAVVAMAKSLTGTAAGKVLELGDDLTANALRLVDYARSLQWTGETTAAALGRMGQYLTVLDIALDQSGQQVDITGQAFVDLARNLAAAADVAKIGIEGLLQLQAFYFEQFTSAQDKVKRAIEAAAQAVAAGLGGLPDRLDIQDRGAFIDLITGLDLTTAAGRQLYVELMKLAPAFDVLFDSLEAFKAWLAPADQVTAALASLTQLFGGWGLSLPQTRAELEKLVASGGLTTEQMAILGGYLDALRLVFDSLGDAVDDVTDRFEAQRQALQEFADQLDSPLLSRDDAMAALHKAGYQGDPLDPAALGAFLRALAATGDAGGAAAADLLRFASVFEGVFDEVARIGQQRADLELRLLEVGGDPAALLAEQRRRELAATDVSNRPLLERIYRLEDYRKQQTTLITTAYDERIAAIEQERAAAQSAHQAALQAISAQREVAQQTLSILTSTLSTIQSALSTLRGAQELTAASRTAAARQLAAWAQSGRLPDQGDLEKVLGVLTQSTPQDYQSEAAYRAAQAGTYANLLKLEQVGTTQVNWAEATVASLDRQAEAAAAANATLLSQLDAQQAQAAAQRDAQLKALENINLVLATQATAKATSPQASPSTSPAPTAPLAGGPLLADELAALKAELVALRQDAAATGTAQVSALKSLDSRLLKWDLDGSPPWRDDGAGTTATILKVA